MKKLILLNYNSQDGGKRAETIIASLPEIDAVSIISNSSQLSSIISASEDDELIIADQVLLSFPEQLAQAIEMDRSADAVVIQMNSRSDEASSESITSDSLVNLLAAKQSPDFLAIYCTANALKGMGQLAADLSAQLALANIMITAVAGSFSTLISSGQINLPNENGINAQLNDIEKAQALSSALNMINIEELFPDYAWADFEKESAAACFHTLAAHFIRLGDTKSAEECLAMSEGLEDSPRALALRALIFKQQGQTLGAVANLVSSLQQYETRKKNTDNQHYLTFSPNDLELVNSSLQRGLSALNKHENDKAFSHFVDAVLNFDDFYTNMGIANQIKQ